MTRYIATTADGRYGLTGPAEDGYYYLWRRTAGFDYEVGAVLDPANIELAADAADEEAAALLADARQEFGF